MSLLQEALSIAVSDKPEMSNIDDTDPDCIYVGWAAHGTAENATGWRIKRIARTAGIVRTRFAGANSDYKYIWDSRASYSY